MTNNRGVLLAFLAYFTWGVLPIYWKQVSEIDSFEIILHRVLWSFVFAAVLVSFQGKWQGLISAVRQPRVLLTFFASGALLGINWYLFIDAINRDLVVEASLGYFINPLLSIFLGFLLLKEKLRAGQWLAIAIAIIGVLYLTIQYGQLPWLALALAASFGFYGLLRKTATLDSLEGLTLETSWLSILALGTFIWLYRQGNVQFFDVDTVTQGFLLGAGAATAIPLLLYAAGARRIPLSLVGIMQYIAPTLQFLIGWLVYGELVDQTRLTGFSIVWVALLVYWFEGVLFRRKTV